MCFKYDNMCHVLPSTRVFRASAGYPAVTETTYGCKTVAMAKEIQNKVLS